MDISGPGAASGRKREAEPDQDCIGSKLSSDLRSNVSKDWDCDFKGQTGSSAQRSESSASCGPGPEALKSDHSMGNPIAFEDSHERETDSGVSLRSNVSKDWDCDFKGQTGSSAQRSDQDPSVSTDEPPQTNLDIIFLHVKDEVLSIVQQELQKLHRLLDPDYPQCSESEEEEPRTEVLNIALEILNERYPDQAEHLRNKTKVGCSNNLKSQLQRKFSHVLEGVPKAGDSAPLTEIYTEHYITEGGASEVNQEHEVRRMEISSRRPAALETIKCEDIFKARPHSPGQFRTVLTKGVAGVGKTVLTRKYSLDWAEGKSNQDVLLLFPFTFRELNVLKDKQFSLMELLHHYFSLNKSLCNLRRCQVLFIFDGLDECRLPLNFRQTPIVADPTESVSVDVLLVNLIRGDLLPSALLWITTRPAAANQIPAVYVSMVTEVRGFTEPQKEQYFMKRFKDKAILVISHIKNVRSLHIMCHLPIFCWLISTVIQKLLEQTERPELPQTLTRMYAHFLVVQAKVQNIKYHQGSGADLHWTPETREMVQSLGKLAFEQLQKGNLIFYECDLSECGLDPAEVSVYSGVFTQVFREEPGLYQDKVYCFIHLSVQEFLAALYVHQIFFSSGQNMLASHSSESAEITRPESEDYSDPSVTSVASFYHTAVDQALLSPNGHLDLFLRFLMGLSLPTNQSLLRGLLTQTERDQTNQEAIEYIKKKLNKIDLTDERSLNLLHCLNELGDCNLVKEIQEKLRKGHLSFKDMSSFNWTTLCFILLSSNSDLEEFDLRKYDPSETALLGLLMVVKASTKALLSSCGLSPHSCGPLASVLSSSSLTHLDLSHNDLQDSGVELLCSELKSPPCRLQTLRLSGCLVSERGGAALASALSSSHSQLREVDLSYNHLGLSAKLLTALQDDPHRPLQSVRLHPAGEHWMVPGLKKYSCEVSLDPNTANSFLLLSEDNRTVTRVKENQQFPEHEDRFTCYSQVLSATELRGCCYWEVDWSGKGGVSIAVASRAISRKGKGAECRFGDNDRSWNLRIVDGDYYVWHNNRPTQVYFNQRSGQEGVSSDAVGVSSGRVAVFLDSEAKSLSFYICADGQLFHLHTFSICFSEPLFPGFRLWTDGSSVTLVKERRQ